MSKRSVVHMEIPSADTDTMKDFYSKLCNWEVQEVPMPGEEGVYTMFSTGNVGAALVPVSEHAQPGNVLIYLSSEDIEADLKLAESLGAKVVMPKMVVGEHGAMGVFVDPAGNPIAFWQNADSTG